MTYRLITSPVKEFPGTVEFPEYLTLPQVLEYKRAADSATGTDGWEHAAALLPVQQKLTGEWRIEGMDGKPPLDLFPFTPAPPAMLLLRWLHSEFVHLIVGEQFIPNEPRPEPTTTPATPATSENQTS
jgi:hypothetical protein